MNFKTNLAATLKDTNISALARKSGISDETIRSILAGRSEDPLLSTVIKIAQGLEISLDELVFNKKVGELGDFPFNKDLWKESIDFTENYIENNRLTNSIKLKQLLYTIDSIFEHSVTNGLKTIDKNFALWFCQKNLK